MLNIVIQGLLNEGWLKSEEMSHCRSLFVPQANTDYIAKGAIE